VVDHEELAVRGDSTAGRRRSTDERITPAAKGEVREVRWKPHAPRRLAMSGLPWETPACFEGVFLP
jgi:hypothetical protein